MTRILVDSSAHHAHEVGHVLAQQVDAIGLWSVPRRLGRPAIVSPSPAPTSWPRLLKRVL